MLAKVAKDLFSSTVRSRGERYFKMKKVRLVSWDRDRVCFNVSGSGKYSYECVFIKQKNRKKPNSNNQSHDLSMSCECPYFRDYDYCKHLWASIKKGDTLDIWSDLFRDSQKKTTEKQTPLLPNSNPSSAMGASKRKPWEKNIIDELTAWNTLYRDGKDSGQLKLYYSLDYYNSDQSGLSVHFYKPCHSSSRSLDYIEKKDIKMSDFEKLLDPKDRELFLLLTSQADTSLYWGQSYSSGVIHPHFQNQTLNKLCGTGRLFIESGAGTCNINSLNFLKFNENAAEIKTQLGLGSSKILLSSHLECGDEKVPLEDITVFWSTGSFLSRKTLGQFPPEYFEWIKALRELSQQSIPKSDKDLLVRGLFKQELTTDIELSKNMGWAFNEENPKPKMVIKEESKTSTRTEFYGEVLFMYGESEVSSLLFRKYSVDEKSQILYSRNFEKESELLSEIEPMNFKPAPMDLVQSYNFRIRKDQFITTIKELMDKGWQVEARGKKVESATNMNFSVTSGTDWFDLESHVTFESGEELALEELFTSLKKGEKLIALGNGQYGMLPEKWLEKYSSLTEVGQSKGNDGLRFSKAQGLLLNGWFAGERNFKADRGFF